MIGSSESFFVAVVSTFGSALTSGKWKISSRKLYKTLERGQFTFHHRCLLSAWRGDGKKTLDVADIVVPGVLPLTYFIHATAVK